MMWTAVRETPAWTAPHAAATAPPEPPSFRIAPGDRVRALTGTLYMLEAGAALMREDFSTDASYLDRSTRHRRTVTLQAQETVSLLAPRGGAVWTIWHRGGAIDANLHRVGNPESCARPGARCAGVVTKVPVTRWWVMVMTRNDQVGWIATPEHFAIPSCD